MVEFEQFEPLPVLLPILLPNYAHFLMANVDWTGAVFRGFELYVLSALGDSLIFVACVSIILYCVYRIKPELLRRSFHWLLLIPIPLLIYVVGENIWVTALDVFRNTLDNTLSLFIGSPEVPNIWRAFFSLSVSRYFWYPSLYYSTLYIISTLNMGSSTHLRRENTYKA